eukprot:2764547-Rhodomonas_salina.1
MEVQYLSGTYRWRMLVLGAEVWVLWVLRLLPRSLCRLYQDERRGTDRLPHRLAGLGHGCQRVVRRLGQ